MYLCVTPVIFFVDEESRETIAIGSMVQGILNVTNDTTTVSGEASWMLICSGTVCVCVEFVCVLSSEANARRKRGTYSFSSRWTHTVSWSLHRTCKTQTLLPNLEDPVRLSTYQVHYPDARSSLRNFRPTTRWQNNFARTNLPNSRTLHNSQDQDTALPRRTFVR